VSSYLSVRKAEDVEGAVTLPAYRSSTPVGLSTVTDAPIGIFDSGVGGLTVARAVRDQLPNESILYVGDTAHSPYGPKPIAEVRAYALEVLDLLVDQGVKMLVIACNTASAAMLRDARERYDMPVVEVIQPAVRRAVSTTKTGRVGVIGTSGTVNSRAYEDAFAAAPSLRLFTQACPRFVEFVENGVTSGDELLSTASRYLSPLRDARVDTLVLGCTHYPFLKGAISYVMGEDVALVSSDVETASDVYRVLVERGLERVATGAPSLRYEATGTDTDAFLRLAHRLAGPEVSRVEVAQTGVIDLPTASAHS
jgi:glutamate racemase